jgi:hypothetical protein
MKKKLIINNLYDQFPKNILFTQFSETDYDQTFFITNWLL